TKKDKSVTEKTKQEIQTKERIDQLHGKISSIENEVANQLIDLETDAEEASFEHHSLNVQDFERNKHEDFDITVCKKEAETHYELLDSISEQIRTYEQTKEQIADLEKTIADTQQEIDQIKREENDWKNVFETDKQEKINEIHAWVEKYHFFPIDSDMLQQTSRDLFKLYEPTPFEAVRAPFLTASNTYQLQINEKIATKNSERTEIDHQIT